MAVLGFELEDLMLPRKKLHHLSHTLNPKK
jgi:hypothetical protein